MVGIYKITNKLNGKSYIGQSIHCGKRFDEHYKGNQLIDEIMQIEGIENFTYEILKEVVKEELSYWEDYYIIKYNTLIPNGYNKKYNCSKDIREKILNVIKTEYSQNIINREEEVFVPISFFLNKEISYNDSIYMWLLLHSNYNKNTNQNYIKNNDFTFLNIAKDIGKSRDTVSKRFKKLLSSSYKTIFLIENKENQTYIFPHTEDIESIPKQTIFLLFNLCAKYPKYEEVIKIYLWLKKQYKNENKNISLNDLIIAFGHSNGHEQIYNRYKDIFTILQDVGLIKFETNKENFNSRDKKGKFNKTFYIYQVNDNSVKSNSINKEKMK